ncbi:alpha/beta fold hydrolase [Bradyrhizobium sp. URHD0069]|uniref:alpha/beta hydrolase n=1 Tax=Bradyrhizobium sp. URHD0069 TaxID=1380355 RepID=UPI0009DF9859
MQCCGLGDCTNTKFRDAVFRTAQIVWDLQFQGTTVLFSWPSRGEIADYIYDQNSALGSRAALLRVVANLRKAGFQHVDILAHSMGNLIAVDALSNSASTKSPVAIAQLRMAAPDVDRDMFIQAIPRVAKVAKGLTLYASANDRALWLSKRVPETFHAQVTYPRPDRSLWLRYPLSTQVSSVTSCSGSIIAHSPQREIYIERSQNPS